MNVSGEGKCFHLLRELFWRHRGGQSLSLHQLICYHHDWRSSWSRNIGVGKSQSWGLAQRSGSRMFHVIETTVEAWQASAFYFYHKTAALACNSTVIPIPSHVVIVWSELFLIIVTGDGDGRRMQWRCWWWHWGLLINTWRSILWTSLQSTEPVPSE